MKENKRWKVTHHNYVFDKYIFKGVIGLVFIYLFIVCASLGFDFRTKFYVRCDLAQGCQNPFYSSPGGDLDLDDLMPQKYKEMCVWEWCNDEFLPSGFEFGTKPNVLFNWAWLVASVLFAGGFLLNHYWHNKGKKIKWLDLEDGGFKE